MSSFRRKAVHRDERDDGEQREHDGGRVRARDVEPVVLVLDVLRQRLGLARDVPETTATAPNSPRQRAVVRTTP